MYTHLRLLCILAELVIFHYVMPLFVLGNLSCSEVCFIEISMAMTAFFWLASTGVSTSVLHKNRTDSWNIYSVYTHTQLPVPVTHKKLSKVSGAHVMLYSFFQKQLRDTLMTQRDRDKNFSMGPERKWVCWHFTWPFYMPHPCLVPSPPERACPSESMFPMEAPTEPARTG